MRAVNWLYINALLPLHKPELYRGLAGEMRKQEESERASIGQNRQRQWESLLRLLQYAYDSVPFYRERFDRVGLHPREISSPSDLAKIPPLTREDIRIHQDALWSRRYRRDALLPAATGGTTDTPVRLLRSPESMLKKAAVHFRFNSWAGMCPGDKAFYLWGARVDYAENPTWRWRFFDRYVMRRAWAPTSLFNEEVLESYRQSLNAFRPRIIYAYPTPLGLFCEFLRDSKRPYYKPTSAICTAEPLLAHQRKVIQEVLECPVFEMYGSREFGMIASECEYHRGLHLNPSAAFAEFLPVQCADGEGLCEILVTDLLNDGMPLIRYKVNDCARVAREPCPCGRGYPVIQQIVGRTMDNFYLPNGDMVPGISLTNRVIQICPGIQKMQVIQDTLNEFRLRFVPGDTFSADDLRVLGCKLDEYFGRSVRWTFERVAGIERAPSGKTRFCISHVLSPQSSAHLAENEVSRCNPSRMRYS